ncbi:hypothetical protein [Cupriavidus oxalaticus]|jgi:hypothetical protein|nr:hypothetical protein [Cupriavidus oxalaticus]
MLISPPFLGNPSLTDPAPAPLQEGAISDGEWIKAMMDGGVPGDGAP